MYFDRFFSRDVTYCVYLRVRSFILNLKGAFTHLFHDIFENFLLNSSRFTGVFSIISEDDLIREDLSHNFSILLLLVSRIIMFSFLRISLNSTLYISNKEHNSNLDNCTFSFDSRKRYFI